MRVLGGLNGLWRRARGAWPRGPAEDDERLYGYGAEAGYGYGFDAAGALWRGLSGRSLEIAEVQEEVAAELRGQVLVAGLDDAAVRGLLARLRGQPPVPSAGPIYREGFFTLVTLPAAPGAFDEGDGNGPDLAWGEVLGLASEADVVLYVWPAGRSWQAADDRWYARLRATGRPLILVAGDDLPPGEDDLPPGPLPTREGEAASACPSPRRGGVGDDLPPGPLPAREGEMCSPFPCREGGQGVRCNVREGGQGVRCNVREGGQGVRCNVREGGQGVRCSNGRQGARCNEAGQGAGRAAQESARPRPWPAGERPVRVRLGPDADEEGEAPADVLALVARILERCSRLAIPLAQEIPPCRPMIADRVIRHAALTAALLGAEPIPLLDLPLQVAVHWRMALQLAAIAGHGTLDYRSREMIGTVAWNLGLRRLIQQVLKLVPVLGWAASAGLSGLATWLLGNGLWRYFEGEEQLPSRLHAWRAAMRVRWQAVRGRWPAIGAPLARIRSCITCGQSLRLLTLRTMKARLSHQDSETRQRMASADPHPRETGQNLDRAEHTSPASN